MNASYNLVSYEEAAAILGCDHHYVRMLVSKGTLNIAERIEVRPNVLKVYLDQRQVEAYNITRTTKRHVIKVDALKWARIQDILAEG
jgi:tRNA A22 N-methylase